MDDLPTDKAARYSALLPMVEGLLAGERDLIANAANLAALLWQSLPDCNWIGFYFDKDGELVVGPSAHPKLFMDHLALRSGRAWTSPVTLLVHDRAGLLVSYRGAIALREMLDLPDAMPDNPCESCATKPCLTACPPRAMTATGYDVPACHSFLNMSDGADCLSLGCGVRHACPVSQGYGRLPEQSSYHMRLFHP